MNNKLEITRNNSVLKLCKDIDLNVDILYIGAHPERFQLVNMFKEKGAKLDLLEIFKPNVDYFLNEKTKIFNNIILGDIRNIDKLIDREYDGVVWWHGPEHITKNELKDTLMKLENITTKWVIIGCPWGIYKQDEVYGNIYEKHLNYIYPNDLESLGYICNTIGQVDKIGSNISSIKIL